MSCWTLLGLPASADIRTLKRHYARLLKQTRPDEDPEGFQRLRDAYEVALHAKQQEQEPPAFAPAWPGAQPARLEQPPAQRVASLLKGLRVDLLDQRYQQAQDEDCAYEFELALLRHCVEHPASATPLLNWCFEHLRWMSAWQRLDLPEYLVEGLQQQLYQQLRQPLERALLARDASAFTLAYARRSEHPWLQHLQHREEFNQWLAQLLINSPYWSVEVFQVVCAGQGWSTTASNSCPHACWPRLLKRHQAPLFLARQRQLAGQAPISPEHRAARLLLAPLSFSQRRAWARHLTSRDWAACQTLAASIAANHPEAAANMPAGNPFFWRDWQQAIDTWPLHLGVALACLAGATVRYGQDGSSPWEIIGVALFWSLCFSAAGEGLQRLWRPLSQRLLPWDERLSQGAPWRETPYHSWLALRDVLPVALLGALLAWIAGPVAGATYAGVRGLVALARQRQIDPLHAWQRINPWPRRLLLGAALVLTCAGLGALKWLDGRHSAGRDQGLQPWTERLCARMPADAAQCGAPATEAQWYPKGRQP